VLPSTSEGKNDMGSPIALIKKVVVCHLMMEDFLPWASAWAIDIPPIG
jgi:hypothetical protein